MQSDIVNIGVFRLVNTGGRMFDLFNVRTQTSQPLTQVEWAHINRNRDVATCEAHWEDKDDGRD